MLRDTFEPQFFLPKANDLCVVVGAGRSGEAAARLLLHMGCRVRVLEQKAEKLSATFATFLDASGASYATGEHTAEQFSGAVLLVLSPGIPVPHIAPFAALLNCPLIGELELAVRYLAQRDWGERIVALTGTSGKTTTVSLIASVLEEAGRAVFLGGNIGTPLCEYLLSEKKSDVLVLEVSSFQLESAFTLHPHVAVLLNLSENHLDHHADMQEYTDTKFRIFAQQDNTDLAILAQEFSTWPQVQNIAARVQFIATAEAVAAPVKTRLLGAHNQYNIAVALAVCQELGISEQRAQRAIARFAPLVHRLEKVGAQAGVVYVNDSKSTTVDSLRVALQSMGSSVWLLAGGVFKGGDLRSLIPLMRGRVRGVALFGTSREIFEEAFAADFSVSWDATLREAVLRLAAKAASGDVVLLSPATASYDLYANYMERGDDFRRIVEGLS